MCASARARLVAAAIVVVALTLTVVLPATPAGAAAPAKPIDTVSTSSGRGSWSLYDTGAVVARGDARPFGSVGSKQHRPFAGVAGTADDGGYWVAAADGAVYAFGGAPFYGSLSGRRHSPVVDVIAGGGGYVLRMANGTTQYFGPSPRPSKEAEPASTRSEPAPTDADFDRLAQCESGQRWDLDSGNGYYGGLQFSAATWQALGYDGLPSEYPRDVQIEAARRTWRQRGWSAWPACSRQSRLS